MRAPERERRVVGVTPDSPAAEVEAALAAPVVVAVVHSTRDGQAQRDTVASLLEQTWPRLRIVVAYDVPVRSPDEDDAAAWCAGQKDQMPGREFTRSLDDLPDRWLVHKDGRWDCAAVFCFHGSVVGRLACWRAGVESTFSDRSDLFLLLSEGQVLAPGEVEDRVRSGRALVRSEALLQTTPARLS